MDQNTPNSPPPKNEPPQATSPSAANGSFFAASPTINSEAPQTAPASSMPNTVAATPANPFQPSAPAAVNQSTLPPQLQSIDTLANIQAAPPQPVVPQSSGSTAWPNLPQQPASQIPPAQPPVVVTSPSESKMDFLKHLLPKIILIAVVLVIIAEIVIYAPKIMSIFGRDGAETTESIIKPPGSSLAVTASKSEFQVGESFKVSVVLDTNNANIQSADAVLKFNPAYLEADTAQGIVTGKVFSSFPVAVIDNASGVVRISGTNGVSKSGFTGIGELATLTFKAKAPGEAAINIDYVPNGTADSNVIDLDGTQDVLKVIEGLSLTIK